MELPNKIVCVAVVLLLAAVIALTSGVVVFAMGATALSAVQTGGSAFVILSGLGLVVLTYLAPTASE